MRPHLRIIQACAASLALLITSAGVAAQSLLRTSLYASGFNLPVAFVQDPGDRSIQYVVEKGGRIRVVRSGTVQSPDFLNLASVITADGERGLLGLAFAPDYVSSGRFYVNFTDANGNTVVARFRRSTQPLVADAASRFDLRWGGVSAPAVIAQPYANHNGGNLAFGPDGCLYVGLGDGGSADDPQHRAQTPSTLLGKMLRVDVSVPDTDPIGYRIPSDNPFVVSSLPDIRREIWSFGLRNPWRYSFDDPAHGGTGALIIGDVGQGSYEEVDYEPAGRGGRNYGWRNREGAHDHLDSPPPAYTPLTDPIHEYDHSLGQSITGGYVYRGADLGPTYTGRYFFADFVNARVWSIGLTIDDATGAAQAGSAVEYTADLGGSAALGNISALGVDADAELYIVSYSLGRIYKIYLLRPPPTPTLRLLPR